MKKYVFLVGAALILRVVGMQWNSLETHPLVATPLTSFPHAKEGVWKWNQGISPYGLTFQQSPFSLLFAWVLVRVPSVVVYVALIGLDVWNGWLGGRIGQLMVKTQPRPAKEQWDQWFHDKLKDGTLLPLVYLWNPYGMVATAGKSLGGLHHAPILLTMYFGLQGRQRAALFSLALATHLSLYPAILFPALMLLLKKNEKREVGFWLRGGFLWMVWFSAGMGLGWAIVGSWSWLSAFRMMLGIEGIPPNMGLWWYTFLEMFEEFENLFLLVFCLTCVVYVIPLTMRFSK